MPPLLDKELWTRYTMGNPRTDKAVARAESTLRPILGHITGADTVLEVGCNVGINLEAVRRIWPGATLLGCEPNDYARSLLQFASVDIHPPRISVSDRAVDLVFTRGVLSHIPAGDLALAMEEVCRVSARWILCGEYYAPQERGLWWKNRHDLLWGRDWGWLWTNLHPDIRPVDLGTATTDGGLCWWLFKKT